MKKIILSVLIALISLLPLISGAVDNPDMPNLSGDFVQRCRTYEGRILNSGSAQATASASNDYEAFLIRELEKALAGLAATLSDKGKGDLRRSQHNWQTWAKDEIRFIDNQFTPEQIGSSYRASSAMARAAILKARTFALLRYQQELPEASPPSRRR